MTELILIEIRDNFKSETDKARSILSDKYYIEHFFKIPVFSYLTRKVFSKFDSYNEF